MAALLELRRQARGAPLAKQDLVVELDREPVALLVEPTEDGIRAVMGEESLEVAGDWWPGELLAHFLLAGREVTLQVECSGPYLQIFHGGAIVRALVMRPAVAALSALMPVKAPPDLSKFVLSPMPGLLVSLKVKVGMEVKVGEEVAVVEAMKMENVLRALADGRVKAIHAEPGTSLSVDQKILELE